MATMPSRYREVLDGPVPSYLLAQLPSGAAPPSLGEIVDRLERCEMPLYGSEVVATPTLQDAEWQLRVRLGDGNGGSCELDLWLTPSEALEEAHVEWGHLTQEDLQASRSSPWSLGVSGAFGDHALDDFHRHIQALAAVAPDAVTVLDLAACWPRSGEWLREIASTRVPPAPANLFCVHAVYDDAAAGDTVWLHTHGLLRCGSIELEMLGVPRDRAGLMANLIHATATMFIEKGPPVPEEPFGVGAAMSLLWIPWEEGIRSLPRQTEGGRTDRDESHSQPSGILLAPGRRRMGLWSAAHRNPTCYLPLLQNDPLLFVSHLETERMALLARERLATFSALLAAFADDDEWLFLVKLGYQIEGARSANDREHLWFRVHALRDGLVDATLLNEPYHVPELKEGQRGMRELELLSDWSVLTPFGRFDPDNIMRLKKIAAGG